MAYSSLKAIVDSWSASKHVPNPPLIDEQMWFLGIFLKSRSPISATISHPVSKSLIECNPPLVAMLLEKLPTYALTAKGYQTLVSERETLAKIVCAIKWRTTSDRRNIYLSNVLGNIGIGIGVEIGVSSGYVDKLVQEKIIVLGEDGLDPQTGTSFQTASLTWLGAELAEYLTRQN